MAGSTQVVSDSWRVRGTAADVSCRGARGTAEGLSTDNSTGRDRKRPEKASQSSTMEAPRRRGSPRNRYGVAKVRWPLRVAWSAAEADAPRRATAPAPPCPPHLLCIYRAAQPAHPGMQGCRRCHGRRHLPTM